METQMQLTKADKKVAQKRMDEFLSDVRAIMYAQGLPSFLMGISQISDKLARGSNDTIHHG